MKLDARNLTKSYTAHTVLDVGEVTFGNYGIEGLIGPNGAGKSTLLGCLTRRIPPTTGQIALTGDDDTQTDLLPLRAHEVTRLGLIKTNQRIQGFDGLSIRDQLRMAATPPEAEGWRFSWRPVAVDEETEAEIAALFERFPFENPDGPANSGGEKKLVDILRCLMTKPTLLLMDEPTAGLPHEITDAVMALIRERVEAGGFRAVVIEHDLDLIWNNCDYVHFLSEGSILFDGTPDEVKANRVVAEKYMGV